MTATSESADGTDDAGSRRAAAAGTPSPGRGLLAPAAGLLAGAGVVALAGTIEIPDIDGQFSPRWWPQLSGAAVMLFSLAAGARALIVGADEAPAAPERGGVRRILLALGAVLIYGALWQFFDFRLVTVLLVAALVAIGGGRGWSGLVVFPVITTTVLWLLFSVLLRVPV
ncbi:tripartite tricarboxylate transporter TctB family protein [Nesterenkonia sp. F]|uniref:tripartite tricarboxylate transporter TctB family protein n=1 Tax=Nesterenkonia sp. F TaxID=795955 RepID=UPI000255CB19|nr:tripartite tricarboxylate transporter TctB family protein [Nesterenkonia sp. F]